MPYIARSRRESFLPLLKLIGETRIDAAGELNFLIVKLMDRYLSQHGECYRIMNEAMGAANCAGLEFYRRKVVVLEEAKMAENGDVFGAPGATE